MGRILELVEQRESASLKSAASELRCLAGEAMMLDFGPVADAARVGEQAALAGDGARIRRVMAELDSALQTIAKQVS